NDPRSLNDKLRNYITSREFWANVECLYKILEPAKTAVQTVEESNTKIADAFLILIKIAIAIKALPTTETTLERLEFRKKCIIFYNKRWAEFDTDFYLLAYFLHPKYHGKGLTSEIFQKILQKALSIWKSQGGGENSALSNLAKLHAYYVTNARHELNYVGQDLPKSDFLKMMHDYAYSLTLGTAIFEEDIQLYDSEDDFEYNSEDNLDDSFEDSFEDNNLSEVNSNMLNIEDSINLEYASNNTNQLLTSDEVIDHGEKDFDIDALASQGMQMRSASIDVDKNG
ncbi:3157_t:CDS:2, partial [Gigaspora rosea]